MAGFIWVVAAAAVVTAAASFVVLRVSRRFNLTPEVRERDVHQAPTPRLGGVAMYIGTLAACAVAATQREFEMLFGMGGQMWALIGACTLIALVGVLDDLLDLDWMIKLAAQLLATGLLAWSGLQIVSLPVGDTLIVASPLLNFAITVFLMTLVMNAINFIDGLDGLVAGVAIIASTGFFLYTRLLDARMGQFDSVDLASLLAVLVVGICLGFLPFNWHRAKMFMGDTGALLVGLLMASSTVSVTGQLNPAALDLKVVIAAYIPIILPVAILALPLADFVLAVARRLRAGKSPFEADRQHLHHRLLDMGHSPLQAVAVFYLITIVLTLAALLVFITQSYALPSIVLGVGGLLCLLLLAYPAQRIRDAAVQRGLLPWKPTETPAPVYTLEGGTASRTETNQKDPD